MGATDECRHGGLRRKCETCDLEEQLAASQARVAELERTLERERDALHKMAESRQARAETAERERDEARQELSRARELIDPGPLPPTDREWLEAKITFETERADAAIRERDEAVARAEEVERDLAELTEALSAFKDDPQPPSCDVDDLSPTRPDPDRSEAGGEAPDR